MASKDSKARRRRAGRRALTFGWSSGGEGRHRLKPPTGLIAMSAVVLAASAASSTVQAAPAAPPAEPGAAPTSADGNSSPMVGFPQVESHLASGRIIGTSIPLAGGGSASIPATVLAAYQRAADRTNMVQPNCHIPLELLAAIGKVESGHARGGRVDAAGRTLTPILGPVLNGGAFAAIPDTDDGAFDGDTTWDRAVGPMQFIPGTWERWASDGNLDGRLDPHNVYDASLAAARYLCAANRDLGTPAGLDEAVLSYNHSTSYLSLVRSWMAVYQGGTMSVEDITDPGGDSTLALGSDGPVLPAASPPAGSPPATPPATPPASTPVTPPPSTPPSTDPSTPPTSTPTDPPPTDPSTPPATEPEPPVGQPPPEPPTSDPAEQCGLVDVVGGLVGGLLGESPDCVMGLELSAPVAPPAPEPPPAPAGP